MDRMLRVILVITLASVLNVGLVMSGCSGESEQNGLALGRITGCAADSAQSLQPGKPAPDFQFQTPEEQSTSLSDLKGKPVLINFWATWCGPCVHEMPFIQQVYEEWQGEELVLLAINIGESSSQAAEFMRSYGFSFPVLLDTNKEVARVYNIQYIPTTFLIDKEGIIQGIKVGAFQSKAEIESGLSQLE
jgi:cytochrome c biogenesis protein CcmG/thiol:disulfide interchange protein DsbE